MFIGLDRSTGVCLHDAHREEIYDASCWSRSELRLLGARVAQ